MNEDLNDQRYPASIRAQRNTRWLGYPLYYYPTVTSTNDVLAAMAAEGAAAGTMVVADYQSEGKGRLGRRWQAPSGSSLLFSLLFRPSWPAAYATRLTMIAGLAALEAVEAVCQLRPKLKWPNDLVLPVGDQWHKFGGMLLEGQLTGGRWEASILGTGINVNISPQQIPTTRPPATSLFKETGRHTERAVLLGELLTRLEQGYLALEQGESPHAEWERYLVTLGQRVSVTSVGDRRRILGVAEGTDEWGRLFVRDDDGHEHVVSAGDVTLQVDNSGE